MLQVGDRERLSAWRHRQRIQVPSVSIVVDELVFPGVLVVDVDSKVRCGRRLLVDVVHGALRPGHENPAIGQNAGLSVPPNRRRPVARRNVRRENLELRVLFVQTGVPVGLVRSIRVVVEAHSVVVIPRIDLEESSCVNRPVARRANGDHDVGRYLFHGEERVDRL